MPEKRETRSWVMINRAPVLTLWASAVAEMLGFDYDEALTLGRALSNNRPISFFSLPSDSVKSLIRLRIFN